MGSRIYDDVVVPDAPGQPEFIASVRDDKRMRCKQINVREGPLCFHLIQVNCTSCSALIQGGEGAGLLEWFDQHWSEKHA